MDAPSGVRRAALSPHAHHTTHLDRRRNFYNRVSFYCAQRRRWCPRAPLVVRQPSFSPLPPVAIPRHTTRFPLQVIHLYGSGYTEKRRPMPITPPSSPTTRSASWGRATDGPEELLELNQQKAAGEVEEEEMPTYVEPTSEAVLMRGLFRGSMWAQGAVALEDEWLDFGAGSRLRIGEQVTRRHHHRHSHLLHLPSPPPPPLTSSPAFGSASRSRSASSTALTVRWRYSGWSPTRTRGRRAPCSAGDAASGDGPRHFHIVRPATFHSSAHFPRGDAASDGHPFQSLRRRSGAVPPERRRAVLRANARGVLFVQVDANVPTRD